MRPLLLSLLILALAGATARAATYYVDGASGDDSADGRTPQTAWKSLQRVNRDAFEPGDRILFKRGTRYTGQLAPRGSGRLVEGKPQVIRIAAYGDGPLPRIDGEGKVLDTLLLRNVEFWEVSDLEITNQGAERQPWRTGVHIASENFGPMRHIRIDGLFVHDVNGDLSKEREGCGIYFTSRGRASCFDGLVIENCRVLRTDRNGICQRGGGRTRSTGVVIRNNLLQDIGGDGIKTWGSNGALIEHNTLRGGRMRCSDYAAGIWPFDCDDTVVQFNEVSGMKGIRDGQGFDADYRCRRTLIQYNYSHDNDGGFILVCSPGNSFNQGTVIRYNISQNDGLSRARVFQLSGNITGTQIYNNTIYLGPRQDVPLLQFTTWDRGHAHDTRIVNNLFYIDGQARCDWGESEASVFEGNLIAGRLDGIPNGAANILRKPPLANPGGAGDGFETLKAYRLLSAPDFVRGRVIPDNGARDLFGVPVPPDAPPCIGASEAPDPRDTGAGK